VTVAQAAASVTLLPTSLSFTSVDDTTTLVPTVISATNYMSGTSSTVVVTN
jgi:hypothetical protein